MIDGAFTEHFDETGYLLLGLAWLLTLTVVTGRVFKRRTKSALA